MNGYIAFTGVSRMVFLETILRRKAANILTLPGIALN